MLVYAVQYLRAYLGFASDDEGVTSVEYAVMVAAIALVVIAGAVTLGLAVNGSFSNAATKIGSP